MISSQSTSLKAILSEITQKDIRDQIVNKLGSTLGLGKMDTATNFASTKGTDPKIIAKAISKDLGVPVRVTNPGEKGIKGKKVSSKFFAVSFELNKGKYDFKLSKGSTGGAPKDAAFYEMGICVEYNKSKGMDRAKALSTAQVDATKYEPYEDFLTDVCGKVVKDIGNVGSSLSQTGGISVSPAAIWPSSDGTPKTDIFGGGKNRISVKKKGGSQLASGKGGDAKGILGAGLAYYEKFETGNSGKVIQAVIDKIDTKFKTINSENTAGDIRRAVGEAYIKYRKPILDSIIKQKNLDVKLLKKSGQTSEKHAKAEAMAAGFIGGGGNYKKWFIPGIPAISSGEINKWFKSYTNSKATPELRAETQKIIEMAIDHKSLDKEFKAIFNDDAFKKWCIYEAATGNYKFTGKPTTTTSTLGAANKILVFGLNGSAYVKDITPKWASGYVGNVTANVSFKTSGRSKSTAFRMVQESTNLKDLVNSPQMNLTCDLDNILTTEANKLQEGLCGISDHLNEGIIDSMKSIGTKIYNSITALINKFYQNVVKRAISVIKEYAAQGLSYLIKALGLDMTGQVNVNLKF
jgi:hypothetical protein